MSELVDIVLDGPCFEVRLGLHVLIRTSEYGPRG